METSIIKTLPYTSDPHSPRHGIKGERQPLPEVSGNRRRIVGVTHGKFYTESMVVRDSQGKVLKRGVDYKLVEFDANNTLTSGYETCRVISVLNTQLSGYLDIDYQATGGGYLAVNPDLTRELEETTNAKMATTWEKCINLQSDYPPAPHSHQWYDLFGMSPFVKGVERLASLNDGVYGGATIFARLQRHRERARRQRERLDAVRDRLNAHIDSLKLPHKTKPADLGYPGILPYQPAVGDVLKSDSKTHLVFAADAVRWADERYRQPISDHLADRSNVHKVTAKQVNGYSIAEFNELLSKYQKTNSTVPEADTLNGLSLADLRKEMTSTLPTVNVIGDPLSVRRIGTGQYDSESILNGQGEFIPGAKLVKDAFRRNVIWTVHRFDKNWVGTIEDARKVIANTYSDRTKWPSGAVVFFSFTTTFTSKSQVKGKAVRRLNQIRVARRGEDGVWQIT